jgi:thymidylate synthase (FAD)
MNLIDYDVEIITEKNPLKRIELCGRTCYNSVDKIKEGSARKFVDMLVNAGHCSVLEHCRVLVPRDVCNSLAENMKGKKPPYGLPDRCSVIYSEMKNGKGLFNMFTVMNARDFIAIGGTVEQLETLEVADDFITVRFTIPIAMSRELCRHREDSFSEQSTRYCNYAKQGIVFTIPDQFELDDEDYHFLELCEMQYNRCIEKRGMKPQQARFFLPLLTRTELIMTATKENWKHVLALRDHKDADPEMQVIMKLLKAKDEFNYINS